MGVSAGTAFIDIQPKIGQGFFARITGALGGGSGALKGAGVAAGAAIGGGVLVGLGGAAALGGIGTTFESAFNQIRIGTGATGDALSGLQDDMKAVFSSVPTDAGLAATAIADFNTRMGVTGETLQGVSIRGIEASRLLGEDLGGLIASSTRMFGDWGIANEDAAGSLDKVFRASQSTGISMSGLQDLLVTYGAPLRQFGFDVDESTAFLASFEKVGVNTELVVGSLRQALGRFARDGRDPAVALQETMEAIASTGDVAEANLLAIEVFGARAGPDMAAAIREGRFEVGELLDTIKNGDETILDAAADTETLGQKFTKLKNRVFVGLEPLATKFVDALGRLFDVVGPKIEPFIQTISAALAPLGAVFSAIVGGAESTSTQAGPIFEGLKGIISGLGTAFQTAVEIITSIWNTMAGVFRDNSEGIKSAVSSIGTIVQTVFEAIALFWNTWGEDILSYFAIIWGAVIDVISGALSIIEGIIEVVMGVLTGDWSRAWDGIKSILSGALGIITGIVSASFELVLDVVTSILGKVVSGIGGFVGDTIGAIAGWGVDFVKAIATAIAGIPQMFIDLGASIVSGIVSGLGGIGTALKDKLIGGIGGALSSVKSFFGIGSPSKVFRDEVGVALAEGVAVGVKGSADGISQTLVAAISRAQSQASDLMSSLPSSGGLADTVAPSALSLDDGGRAGFQMILNEGAVQVFNDKSEDAALSVPRELRRLALDLGRA